MIPYSHFRDYCCQFRCICNSIILLFQCFSTWQSFWQAANTSRPDSWPIMMDHWRYCCNIICISCISFPCKCHKHMLSCIINVPNLLPSWRLVSSTHDYYITYFSLNEVCLSRNKQKDTIFYKEILLFLKLIDSQCTIPTCLISNLMQVYTDISPPQVLSHSLDI